MEDKELAFVSDFQPAQITADFDGMRARLEKELAPYEGMTDEALAKCTAKEIRGSRAKLNAMIKDVEDGRKGVKRAYNAPLKAFEDQVKELLAPARAAEAQLKAALDEKEEDRKRKKRGELIRHYEEFAPELVPYLPYDTFADPKWMNASPSLPQCEMQLEERVAKINDDWKALKSQKDSLPYYEPTENLFFRTLDLGGALRWNRQQQEEAASHAELEAKVEANRAEQEPQPEAQQPPSTAVFRVEVPYGHRYEFADAMKALGWAHGKMIGVE